MKALSMLLNSHIKAVICSIKRMQLNNRLLKEIIKFSKRLPNLFFP